MADVPAPSAPRPYRILLEIEGAQQWIPVWGYDIREAVLSACIKLGGDVGSDEIKICEATPDFEAYVKMARGVYS